MLRPRKRITKKEIKEDALVTAYFKVRKFFQDFNRQLNIGFFIALAIIVIVLLMVRSKNKAQFTAASKLGIAENLYHQSNYTQVIDTFTEIVDTYSGTGAAGRAAYYLGNAYYMTGDYDRAEKYYHLYIDNYQDDELLTISSTTGVAACYEHKQLFLDAAQLYEKAGKKYTDAFTAPFCLRDAGRCYQLAEKNGNAKDMYSLIIDKYPEFGYQQEVELLLETL